MIEHSWLLYAVACGIGVAAVAGPLGCFLVWRRLAYFGDTLAHSALLGVAIGLLLAVDVALPVLAVALTLAVLLGLLQTRQRLASDTLLGIFSHGSLALGMVLIALLPASNVDVMGYLFGDLLVVGATDVWTIFSVSGLALVLLLLAWRSLLAITVDEALAHVEGHRVFWLRMLLMCLLAFVVAAAMKVVGALLITSLLIIPAASARIVSRSPEAMAVMASLFGILAVLFGLYGSWHWDLPSGPAIVVAETAIFIGLSVVGALQARDK